MIIIQILLNCGPEQKNANTIEGIRVRLQKVGIVDCG
jgi:hypothetical protein